MNTRIFFVRVRKELEKDFQDFFPHMSKHYIAMSHLFDKTKRYPVLAVEKVTIFDKDGNETASSRFLVPTENSNMIWVQSEIFLYDGIT